MGEDKSLLPFSSSKTLTQFQYQRLKTFFKNIYLSAKTNKFDFIEDNELILDTNKEIFSPILALDTIFDKLISRIGGGKLPTILTQRKHILSNPILFPQELPHNFFLIILNYAYYCNIPYRGI